MVDPLYGYTETTWKLIHSWGFIILYARYIRATIWARGGGEGYALISISYFGARLFTDRNAVV